MAEAPAPAVLAARAAETRVVVIGGGIGGLLAARECAKVGMRVTLLEATDAVGGAIRRTELDGVALDAGAESFATRGGHVRTLLAELGLTDRIVAPAAGRAWLAGIPGVGAAPLPVGGLLGIPANPFQDDVRRIIGWSGAWRAYVDRVRPPLTIGHQLSLGRLVASRMGVKVRDRLVAPVTTGVYSASPDDVDVDVAAPGLNAALTRVGSLSGAVQALRDTAATGAAKAPGAAVEGLVGGMTVLVDALVADLARLEVDVRTATPVELLSRDGSGWRVVAAQVADAGEDAAADSDDDSAAPVENEFAADAVIVATEEYAARALLAEAVPALRTADAAEAPQIELVTLLLDAPALDAAPRGTGVLTVPGSHTAKALTHSTAKWDWVRQAAGGRHVVRVSFGAQGEPAATAELDDDAAAALALSEASALLGVPLPAASLVAAERSRYIQSQPASIIGSGERRSAARAAVQETPGLAVVGAWLAGTGLAQVVPDAVAEADRLRRALLWD
ncbi:protoporphyrinogen/coproporphyrinogen oxidase [Microbacterium saperdae]|uniref:Oxygen-dependent protoporphyrinogen oxidase n=1 Tax=Microbacterium saperdae TaxID=69368 RepID=A0A543BHY1_9MICO|nr:FAD-dependent oxidoreductase [Microbacterium saperdae]TQL84452.1 oxygen-dependent protoporphyrinogen oxidase [Microbacterium saperdae]GGM60388.1 protoporphyrinogen oxidase [Microbacterium saperdae]